MHERELDEGRPAAAEFQAVFEDVPYAILLLDDERHCIAANRAAARLFGYEAERFTHMMLEDLSPPEAAANVLAAWRQFQASGSLTGEGPILRADGSTVRVRYNAHANYVPGHHLSVLTPVDRAARRSADDGPAPRLSAREAEILQLLANGCTGEEVAVRLFLSPATVQTHVRNAMRKLDARSRAHAVVTALVRGEIEP